MKIEQGLKLWWSRWKSIAHKIGDFQARGILSVFYFIVLAPFALGVKILSDPLQLKSPKGWLTRGNLAENPTNLARRQF
jgi:hypothetical protein